MFKPTFLYIKQHNITGTLYFGKTVKNPLTYKGSGVRWKRILKKYGGQVETLWYCLFTDRDLLIEFATSFSKLNDIVNNPLWANLVDENGLDGAIVGHADFIKIEQKDEVASKISSALTEAWKNPEYRTRMIKARKDAWTEERHIKHKEFLSERWTPEAKLKHSELVSVKRGTNKSKGVPKSAEHNKKNSEALKGKKKSAEHIQNLKDANMLRRVCRLDDHKEMPIRVFTRWLNKINRCQEATVETLP